MSEQAPDRDLADLERALAGLAPAPAQFDRDRLMFRAGQAAAPRPGWAWPTATAALVMLAALLGVVIGQRPPTVVERVVYVEVPAPAPVPAPLSPADVGPLAVGGSRPHEPAAAARLRAQVLRWGVDALPSPSPAAVVSHRAPSVRGLLAEIEQ